MQRTIIRERIKQIRQLWREYMDLRSAERSLGVKQVRKPQIRDEAEIPEERRNVQLARSLLEEGVGGEPEPWRVREIKAWKRKEQRRPQVFAFGVIKCPEAPFKEVDEHTYCCSPRLHDYYSRVYDYEKGKVKTDPTDIYSILSEYLTGWTYLPPIVKPQFRPEAQARQAEIKRRIVETSGTDYWTAVCVAYERPRHRPRWILSVNTEHEDRDEIHRTETEAEVERARIELLCERRENRQYWETPSDSSEPEEIPAKSQEDFPTGTEGTEEYRRKDATITIAEKLGDQGSSAFSNRSSWGSEQEG